MWYIAEVIEEITVEGEKDSVVHINAILIKASSDDEAFERAVTEQYDDLYLNPSGREVRTRFVGLRDLIRIYDDLEDGAELRYEELIGLSPEELSALTTGRDDLTVFRPQRAVERPDYRHGGTMLQVEQMLRQRKAED
jgi:hypothetical protein